VRRAVAIPKSVSSPPAGRSHELGSDRASRTRTATLRGAYIPSANLPDALDLDKLAEAALAILSLTLHDNGRVWKSLDWDLMDLLEEKGWIVEARSRAKSLILTEDGERLVAGHL
jgi:hypothetical protein